jgi:tRNA(Ile)-lysidine synthase
MRLIVAERPQFTLRAVHVDHQLQPASAAWSKQCEQVCIALGVPFTSVQVVPDPGYPEGVEAAARLARYEALGKQLQPGETLLTAHHADDQLETVLLALVRGAGVGGLAAMPPVKRFANGSHMRPLLEFTRAEVESWARAQGLAWIDDPTNELPRFDRNYLRREVLPVLQRRWPSVAQSVSRSALHVGEARHLLEELAEADLSQALVGRCLDMRAVKALSFARRSNLIRRWLAKLGARMPSTRKLAALEYDILLAADDKVPSAAWDDVEVRRYGDLLYCERAQPLDTSLQLAWSRAVPLPLPGTLGSLELTTAGEGLASDRLSDRLPGELQVRFRQGGEKLQLPGRAHRSYLKNLLQDAQVLPWWRERLPLIYSAGRLVAVADLWIAADFATTPGSPAMRIVWRDRPEIFAQARPPKLIR